LRVIKYFYFAVSLPQISRHDDSASSTWMSGWTFICQRDGLGAFMTVPATWRRVPVDSEWFVEYPFQHERSTLTLPLPGVLISGRENSFVPSNISSP